MQCKTSFVVKRKIREKVEIASKHPHKFLLKVILLENVITFLNYETLFGDLHMLYLEASSLRKMKHRMCSRVLNACPSNHNSKFYKFT